MITTKNCDGINVNSDDSILYIGFGNDGVYKYDIYDKAYPNLIGCKILYGDTDDIQLI